MKKKGATNNNEAIPNQSVACLGGILGKLTIQAYINNHNKIILGDLFFCNHVIFFEKNSKSIDNKQGTNKACKANKVAILFSFNIHTRH